MEDKSLIEKEKLNIFKIIKRFFKKLVFKEIGEEVKIEKYNVTSNVIEELKDKQKIIELQQQYEAGYILEQDLSNLQIEKLTLLYKEQIKNLKDTVEKNETILENYKDRITILRKI